MLNSAPRAPRPSRRAVLVSGAGVAAGAATGCDVLSTDPAGQSRDPGPGSAGPNGPEAPALARKVKAGELEPVERRIPTRPLVVQPHDRVGVYGGDWNATIGGPADAAWLERTVGYENLLRWDPEFSGEVLANVAEEVAAEDDGRAYVLTLRKGMRWSDGEPFTADDVIFAYDDVLSNERIFPGGFPYPDLYVVEDTAATFEKVDDVTVRIEFVAPNGLFRQSLATPYAFHLTNYARHYFEQFHGDYHADIEAAAREEGFSDWGQYFVAHDQRWQDRDRPVLYAWRPVRVFGEGQEVVYERNPYYWKTDPEGSQLPYLDRVVYTVVNDPEVVVLRASQGDIDMQDRTLNTPQNKPVLARSRESGDYHFVTEVPSNSVTMAISLNLNHPDPVKRQAYGNKDFRVGLSYAMNRQEIIDTIYQRQGEPYQVAPRPESPYYDEEMAKQFTEYDPDAANSHLDRAGYTERDGDGFRLGSDGNRLRIVVNVVADSGNNQETDALELVRAHWREVGIDMRVNGQARALFVEHREANQHDATVWGAEGGGGIEPLMRTDWYFPSGAEGINYAPLWHAWYVSGGADGQEPPAPVRRQMALYQRLRSTTDEEQRDAQMRELLAIGRDIFFHIGVSLAPMSYGIVKNNFHNVPERIPASFLFPTPAPTNPEQYFLDPQD